MGKTIIANYRFYVGEEKGLSKSINNANSQYSVPLGAYEGGDGEGD